VVFCIRRAGWAAGLGALGMLTLVCLHPTVAAGAPSKATPPPKVEFSVIEGALICPTKSERARSLYNKGKELQKAGNVEGATSAYEQAIQADPKYCDAMDNLGLIFRQSDRLDEAVRLYKQSIAIAPQDGVARMNLAVAYRMKGQREQAIVEYAALVKVLPKDPEGHYGLASVYFELGKFREALAPAREAERLYLAAKSPYAVDARGVLGNAHFGLDEWERAAHYFEQIYSERSQDPVLNLHLGVALVRLKNIESARKYLLKARELGKSVPPDIANLAGL
jgi:tetratricopeptide (TPR) repeat protein